ncbi:MAG: hypothetical protein SFZ03_11690 [Candidatus Melainabacteria bacterium]|nr:hypothetical protein [Candidatus Melainabacteria bacterium]
MPLVNGSIPNLINGVSQQPAPLRLPSQCEEQINAYSSVVEGLKKRPPLEYVAKLNNLQIGNAFIHTINRDASERYVVIITSGDLKVYDLAGTQKTVAFPDGTGYLTTTDAKAGFRAITIADYTFVVNLQTEVQMAADLSPVYGSAGLVFVKQADSNSDYIVFVDGVQKASYTTTTTNIKTNFIATQLATQLTTNLGAGWTVTRVGSTVEIKKNDGTDFHLLVEDSQGETLLKAIKQQLQRFSDLPTIAPDGMVIEITGDQSSAFDNYFVKFETTDTSSTFGRGVWVETVKPNLPYKLDAETMPHALVRESDGTFTFKELEWGERIAGDEDSAPKPSFVDALINDIFFFKNRLGFLSDENVIFSRAGKFFDFFPETVTTILDSDPIDVAASSTKVSILRHAVPFDEDLLLFSDQTQFVLRGGDILSSKTVSIAQKTVFENSRTCKPVGAGKNVFFTVNKGMFSQIREYFVSAQNETNDAADITSHVPKYIPKDVIKLAVATNEDLLCVISPDAPNAIFSYKYYWRGDEKLQSAWSQWTFWSSCTVLNIDFIDSVLYVVSQRSDGVYLEKLNVAPKQIDANSTYLTHLDRRIKNNTPGVSVNYNAGSDETTWTLPYAVTGVMQIVTRDNTVGAKEGMLLPVIQQTGNTVKVKGKYDTEDVFIGQQYAMRFTFSVQFIREQNQNSGQSSVVVGRLQMRTWTIVFEKTGFFTVEVTPKYRDTYRYKFTGNILGSGNNIIGTIPLEDGAFNFLVQSKNDQVKIELVNDTFLPCHFLSAEWEALYTARSQRV